MKERFCYERLKWKGLTCSGVRKGGVWEGNTELPEGWGQPRGTRPQPRSGRFLHKGQRSQGRGRDGSWVGTAASSQAGPVGTRLRPTAAWRVSVFLLWSADATSGYLGGDVSCSHGWWQFLRHSTRWAGGQAPPGTGAVAGALRGSLLH